MTPMRYVRNGAVCFTVGVVLLFISGFSDGWLGGVLALVAYLLWAVAAVLLVIAVIGAGVKAGRSD